MNNHKILELIVTKYRRKVPNSFRNFHSIQGLNQRELPSGYEDIDVDNSLFFTNLPSKRLGRKVRHRENWIMNPGTLLIKCKHKELNHYTGNQFGKFDVVPLASKGWAHRKSKGDFFTILPKNKYSPFLTNEDIPRTFEECNISQQVIQQLKKLNVVEPTVIQAKGIEKLLSGENVLILGECGSGKTLAYVIAMIENILKWKDKVPPCVNSPLGIAVIPSRELAIQVMRLTSRICADLGLTCQALIDGYSQELLANPIESPVDILICTTYAVVKQLRAGIFSTKFCKHVVVDDIDSFKEEEKFKCLKYFFRISKLNYVGLNATDVASNSAQICFISAVNPSSLEEDIDNLLQVGNLTTVSTSHLNRPLYTVPQQFLRVSTAALPGQLLETLRSNVRNKKPTLIFSNRNKTCNWVSFFLKENGIECNTMNHLDLPGKRVQSYRDFEAGLIPALSTTNPLSLGFHFPNLRHVINVEFPRYMRDYIHRCGRVGRLGQAQDCLITNFITKPKEVELVQKIEKAVRLNSQLPDVYCPKSYFNRQPDLN